MGFDEIKKTVTGALGDEKKTDEILDKGADFVNDKTGGKYTDQVKQGRDFIDSKVGDPNAPADGGQQAGGDKGEGGGQQGKGAQGGAQGGGR